MNTSKPPSTVLLKGRDERIRRASGNARGGWRDGVAAVEFAIVLPILLILVLGSVELCQRLYLRQSTTIAAYEGVRVAARKTSAAADVTKRCNSLLADRKITGATVIVTPADFKNLTTGATINVQIKVPWAANTVSRFVLKDTGNIVVNATMLRE